MSAPSEATKQRLIETTIRLVAMHGVKGVSVRTLTSEAGCKNLTAIHYHFGGKRQLVNAAMLWIFERLVAAGEPAFAEIEARIAAGGSVTPRDVVEAWVAPPAALLAVPDIGPLCMRFFARVLTNAADEANADFLHSFVPFFARMLAMFQHVLPGVPTELLVPRIVVFLNSLVHVLSELPGIEKARETFFVDVDPIDALRQFIAYHAAGFSAPPAEDSLAELSEIVTRHAATWRKALGESKPPS